MVDRDPRSDAALLAATAVDPEAFGVFYRRHAPWVLRYVARRVDDRDVVGDLVSEVFASALISLPKFDASRGTPSSWLFGIAAHQLSRYRRRGVVSRRAQRRLGLERVELTDAELEAVEAHDVVSELLAVLPGEQRDAVEARVVDERSYPEIARQAGVSESVARQRVSRGLSALRRITTRTTPDG